MFYFFFSRKLGLRCLLWDTEATSCCISEYNSVSCRPCTVLSFFNTTSLHHHLLDHQGAVPLTWARSGHVTRFQVLGAYVAVEASGRGEPLTAL